MPNLFLLLARRFLSIKFLHDEATDSYPMNKERARISMWREEKVRRRGGTDVGGN